MMETCESMIQWYCSSSGTSSTVDGVVVVDVLLVLAVAADVVSVVLAAVV